jgi:hypothetical protein
LKNTGNVRQKMKEFPRDRPVAARVFCDSHGKHYAVRLLPRKKVEMILRRLNVKSVVTNAYLYSPQPLSNEAAAGVVILDAATGEIWTWVRRGKSHTLTRGAHQIILFQYDRDTEDRYPLESLLSSKDLAAYKRRKNREEDLMSWAITTGVFERRIVRALMRDADWKQRMSEWLQRIDEIYG